MGLTKASSLEEIDGMISDQVAELNALIQALKECRNKEKDKEKRTEINALIAYTQEVRNGMYDLSAKAFVEWYKDNSQVLQEIMDLIEKNPQTQRVKEYLATIKKITNDIKECRKGLEQISGYLEKSGEWLEKLDKIGSQVTEFKDLLFGGEAKDE